MSSFLCDDHPSTTSDHIDDTSSLNQHHHLPHPSWVSKLVNTERSNNNNSVVYLLGIIHGRSISCQSATNFIKSIQPNAVMVELDLDRLMAFPPERIMGLAIPLGKEEAGEKTNEDTNAEPTDTSMASSSSSPPSESIQIHRLTVYHDKNNKNDDNNHTNSRANVSHVDWLYPNLKNDDGSSLPSFWQRVRASTVLPTGTFKFHHEIVPLRHQNDTNSKDTTTGSTSEITLDNTTTSNYNHSPAQSPDGEANGYEAGDEFIHALRQGQEQGAVLVLGDVPGVSLLMSGRYYYGMIFHWWRDWIPTLNTLRAVRDAIRFYRLLARRHREMIHANSEDSRRSEHDLVDLGDSPQQSREQYRQLGWIFQQLMPMNHRVMNQERDAFMAECLNSLESYLPTSSSPNTHPTVVVAVVGLSHVDGIQAELQNRGWKVGIFHAPPTH